LQILSPSTSNSLSLIRSPIFGNLKTLDHHIKVLHLLARKTQAVFIAFSGESDWKRS
jgi:hypothetical protein